jgi:hypothetical protein
MKKRPGLPSDSPEDCGTGWNRYRAAVQMNPSRSIRVMEKRRLLQRILQNSHAKSDSIWKKLDDIMLASRLLGMVGTPVYR